MNLQAGRLSFAVKAKRLAGETRVTVRLVRT
jgi:hypothetical protein